MSQHCVLDAPLILAFSKSRCTAEDRISSSDERVVGSHDDAVARPTVLAAE